LAEKIVPSQATAGSDDEDLVLDNNVILRRRDILTVAILCTRQSSLRMRSMTFTARPLPGRVLEQEARSLL